MVDKRYDNEDQIICPYCGYEETDSWETEHSDDSYECASCAKEFILEVEHTVSYSTKRQKCSDKHNLKLHCAYVKDSRYTEVDGKYKDVPLKQSEWKYIENYECEDCGEDEWKDLLKEEFIIKYKEKYEGTLNHFKIDSKLKQLLDDAVSESAE